MAALPLSLQLEADFLGPAKPKIKHAAATTLGELRAAVNAKLDLLRDNLGIESPDDFLIAHLVGDDAGAAPAPVANDADVLALPRGGAVVVRLRLSAPTAALAPAPPPPAPSGAGGALPDYVGHTTSLELLYFGRTGFKTKKHSRPVRSDP